MRLHGCSWRLPLPCSGDMAPHSSNSWLLSQLYILSCWPYVLLCKNEVILSRAEGKGRRMWVGKSQERTQWGNGTRWGDGLAGGWCISMVFPIFGHGKSENAKCSQRLSSYWTQPLGAFTDPCLSPPTLPVAQGFGRKWRRLLQWKLELKH